MAPLKSEVLKPGSVQKYQLCIGEGGKWHFGNLKSSNQDLSKNTNFAFGRQESGTLEI